MGKIKDVMKDVVQCSSRLMCCVMEESGVNLMADKIHTAEQRRILCTAYNNLKMWFKNWDNNYVTGYL